MTIEPQERKTKEPPKEPSQDIKVILKAKEKGDLYGVLKLEKGCSDIEIKKAYRKVLLFDVDGIEISSR